MDSIITSLIMDILKRLEVSKGKDQTPPQILEIETEPA